MKVVNVVNGLNLTSRNLIRSSDQIVGWEMDMYLTY
mgnify:CR=1 FL=1